MRQVKFDLKTLQARLCEGAFITRRDRSYALDPAANMLPALGFRRLRATGPKRKHVTALVAEWQRRRLAAGTVNSILALSFQCSSREMIERFEPRLELIGAASTISAASGTDTTEHAAD